MPTKTVWCKALGTLSVISLTSFAELPSQNKILNVNSNQPIILALKPLPEPIRRRSEIIFNILAADIAAQRSKFSIAQQHYSTAATLANNGELAELATRSAISGEDYKAAAQELTHWLKIQPDKIDALRIAVYIAVENKNLDQAAKYLQQLVTAHNATGDNGYTELASLLERLDKVETRLELARMVVKDHLNDPNALFALATLEFNAENWKTAEELVRQALVKHPEWHEAQMLLVKILKSRDDVKGARVFLEQLLTSSPNDKKLHETFAMFLLEQSDWIAAQQQFTWLHNHDPKNADAIFALGVIALQLKQKDQAIQYLKQLYEFTSHRDKATFYLGQIFEEDKQTEAALHWYALAQEENKFNAQMRIAQIYAKRGEVFKAREIVQQVRSQMNMDDPQMDLVEAEILREAKQYQAALELLNAALDKTPNNHDLLYTRALTAIHLGQVDVLERDLKHILASDPKHVEALNALGYTLTTETTRYSEALGYIQRALELKPDNPAILDSMGWLQYRLGNPDKALTYLKQALELMPDPEIASHLGEVLWNMGDKEQAVKIWTEALKKTPDSEYILKMRERYGIKF